MSTKVSTGFGWLEDDVTGDPAGVRRHSDGKEFGILLVETDKATGGNEFSAPLYEKRQVDQKLFQQFSATKRRVGVAVGNSLVAGTNTNSAQSFAQQMHLRMPELFKGLRNAGVGGRKSSVVLANLPTDVLDADEFGIYHEGTNDGYASTQATVSEHLANVKAIAQYFTDRGKAFSVVATPTVDTGIAPTTAAQARAMMEKYNLAERFWCEDNGIMFADPWPEFIDPATGGWTSAASVADYIHPPQAVHDKAAINIADQWRSRRLPPLLPRSNLGSGGLAGSNALNLTGALSGWSQNGTAPSASATSAATLPVRGNWSDQTITGLTSAGGLFRYLTLANISAGDRIRLSGYFKFTNTSNMQLTVRLQFMRSVTPNVSLYLCDTSTSFDSTYFEAEVIAPSDITNAIMWLEYKSVNGGSNAYSGSFSWAGFDAYNVTKLTA